MDDPTKDTIPRSAVEYYLRKETVSTNPEKYKTHEKFIDYMNDPDISEFGHWMHSNGFNCALTAISVDLKKIPSVTPSSQPGGEDTVYRKAVQMLLAYFVPEERYAEAVDGLRRLPSAQPERKGKWVGVGYDGDWLKTMCKCSKCGAMIDINEKYRNFFCYHCGARMDGEQDERLNQQTGGD